MSTPDHEPEFIVPSLASRPLASETVEVRSELGSSANPLRAEVTGPLPAGRGVVPAMAIEPAASEASRVNPGNGLVSGVRANPLRD